MSASNKSSYPQLTAAQCESIAIRTLRAQFLAMPPDLQRETLERIKRLGPRPGSYLAKHWRQIYLGATPTKGHHDDNDW